MNEPMMMTPHDLMMMFIAMCGAVVTIGTAITLISSWINKAKQPEVKQNEKIEKLETHVHEIDGKLEKFDEYFDRNTQRFKQIEYTNEITLEALYALLSHSLDGNNTKSLEESQTKLHDYLFSRSGTI